MKKTNPINLIQAQQIERYRFPLIPAKVNWIITGFLFGAFAGWCGAWLTISCING
jgi:uncharacterized membrane protein YdjX (TVP38/TMEM64 family)